MANLILNAIEAMSSDDKGARELSVRIEQRQAHGGVLIEVRDSGRGIDPGNLEQVFEPFYTTKTSGIGMGLSICRSIIGAHGGRRWAEANEPRGAVFQFTLPRAENGFPEYLRAEAKVRRSPPRGPTLARDCRFLARTEKGASAVAHQSLAK